MEKISSICVYLGSSSRCDDVYKQTAKDFGRIMAEAGITLIYGGGRVGLMGILADSVLAHGGKAIGIIPRHLSRREVLHDNLTEMHIVDTMHVRKQMMVDKADAFVVLPGGIGTLDELCEVMTWRQLGMHNKPIVMANINGYWNPFVALIDNVIAGKFMREDDKNIIAQVDKVTDIMPALENAADRSFDPTSKWV